MFFRFTCSYLLEYQIPLDLMIYRFQFMGANFTTKLHSITRILVASSLISYLVSWEVSAMNELVVKGGGFVNT